jgi:hypothetical protein
MAPDVIRDVLEGVLLLMGQEDTSWAAMKAFLGKRSVKEDIINYDTHRCAAFITHIMMNIRTLTLQRMASWHVRQCPRLPPPAITMHCSVVGLWTLQCR